MPPVLTHPLPSQLAETWLLSHCSVVTVLGKVSSELRLIKPVGPFLLFILSPTRTWLFEIVDDDPLIAHSSSMTALTIALAELSFPCGKYWAVFTILWTYVSSSNSS